MSDENKLHELTSAEVLVLRTILADAEAWRASGCKRKAEWRDEEVGWGPTDVARLDVKLTVLEARLYQEEKEKRD
jgi:hypothetical protein